ncbi:hypothetical protein CCAX7_14320 [Capsulimonas corticalis]|uniref:Uncharacterized protein n=1 Tax=Capsulimonas corticalis TaxID=2219043 RepID=A0A402D746_9BACT|nr:hypothetical protein [Capsulimonas corticalis]BDI29381.1 hypothetical protein CCAX7_14320 [Capsulimonas corticalis]
MSQQLPLLCDHGLTQATSDALRRAGVTASRITQTDGHARASKKTHEFEAGLINGRQYCAAVDISVHGMTDLMIRDELVALAREGIAGFYRAPGKDGWSGVQHIHAIDCNLPMKLALREQVHDWLHGKNGLVNHEAYKFWQPCATAQACVRNAFLAHNPADN